MSNRGRERKKKKFSPIEIGASHSLNKLNTYYVLGAIPGTSDTLVNKQTKKSALVELNSSEGRQTIHNAHTE